MLDLTKVAGQIRAMTRSIVDSQNNLREKLSVARDLWGGADWSALAQRVMESKTSMLTAVPTGILQEVTEASAPPRSYTVVATDGSQITPDHHGPALCYLINIGRVMIHYGTGERPLIDSVPLLFYKEEDLYVETDGKRLPVQGELLAAKRAELEAIHLEVLVEQAITQSHPVVALEDGSLIKWTLEQGSDWQTKALNRYLRSLEQARELQVPVCGYLSGSRACDVVNTLKLLLCPENPVNCDKCPYKRANQPCQKLQGITDTVLFKQLLVRPGQRSQMFLSTSKILDRYGEHQVRFFYLHAGSEIARVEVPCWVCQNPALLDLVQAIVTDQAAKGHGYPVALTEAHVKAVIQGADRDTFMRLLETSLIKHGTPVESSTKSLRKRVGFI